MRKLGRGLAKIEKRERARRRRCNRANYEMSRLPKIPGLKEQWVADNAVGVSATFMFGPPSAAFPNGIPVPHYHGLVTDMGRRNWMQDARSLRWELKDINFTPRLRA